MGLVMGVIVRKSNIEKFKNLVLVNLFLFSTLIFSILININLFAQAAEVNNNNSSSNSNSSKRKVGGNRDRHGCLTGAGYSWCELGQSCVRPWELATCFKAKLGPDFTDFANNYALDSSTGNPNNSKATLMLCDPKNNFCNNTSQDRKHAVIQACLSYNSKNAQVDRALVNLNTMLNL